MITVVTLFQFVASLVVSQALRLCQLADALFKVIVQLLLSDTAERGIIFPHRQVHQIIQCTEHADLAKLGDTRQECELDVTVHRFQCAVKSLQGVAERLLQFLISNSLQHRFVVFVDKDGNAVACLFMSPADDTLKAQGRPYFRRFAAIHLFPPGQGRIENIH